MDALTGLAKSLAGRVVRRAAHVASSHPWLARAALRTFATFPTLKLRLRRIILRPDAVATAQVLDDAQIRVLLDLRGATEHHTADRR